jgi:uncharacterized membrane protein (UPF0127 family)
MIWLLYILMVPTGLGLILALWPRQPDAPGPQFQQEGKLTFLRAEDGESIKSIDIEVAQDELEIQRGLMYRRSMEPDQGMLFMMPVEEPQAFWMLNTYLSLDIIFINSSMEIVKIQPNTQPRSLKSIPSQRPALYVVEVLAGFCAENGIEEGDRISFKLETY